MSERIVGVGIDLVSISEIRELDQRTGGVFIEHTFSGAEIEMAGQKESRYSFFAGRFAVKEAVFKAIAHLTPEKTFDFRIVETLRNPDGSPEVMVTEKLKSVMDQAAVTKLLISITNQGDLAMAECIAVGYGKENEKNSYKIRRGIF